MRMKTSASIFTHNRLNLLTFINFSLWTQISTKGFHSCMVDYVIPFYKIKTVNLDFVKIQQSFKEFACKTDTGRHDTCGANGSQDRQRDQYSLLCSVSLHNVSLCKIQVDERHIRDCFSQYSAKICITTYGNRIIFIKISLIDIGLIKWHLLMWVATYKIHWPYWCFRACVA